MQKHIARIIIFFLTLSIGLGLYFVWYSLVPYSHQKIIHSTVETSLESKPAKVNDKSTEPWILKIEPCNDANSLIQPSSAWKGKGIILRGVINRLAICGVLPEYPQAAKDANISGVVVVNVIIDEIGQVEKARATYGNPLLLKSSEKAAYQTRICPTQLGGEPYKVKGFLMYKFDSQRGIWLQDPSAPDNPFKWTTKKTIPKILSMN